MCAVAGMLEFMSNSRLRDCNLQSGAVLWLRHSFAHAFSWDSMLVDCNASARNDTRLSLCVIFSSLRASVTSVAINEQRILMILALHTFDCHEAKASRNDTKNIKGAIRVAPRFSIRISSLISTFQKYPIMPIII